ncbi:MAG: hypothetical protein NTV46_17160 [Verrucomicrobia bacterium]|nr:hypothetical protein [Verrucomicrobiota bacterium]
MSNPLPTPGSPDPAIGSSPMPSISQAANDLRAAAGEKARELVQSAETKAAALKERAVESAQHFRDGAAVKASALKAVTTEKAQHLKESASDQWEDTRVKARELHVTAEDYIRQNPTKCVVSALALGFLIGLIVRR